MSYTTKDNPAAWTLVAIPLPMVPSPMTPIVGPGVRSSATKSDPFYLGRQPGGAGAPCPSLVEFTNTNLKPGTEESGVRSDVSPDTFTRPLRCGRVSGEVGPTIDVDIGSGHVAVH